MGKLNGEALKKVLVLLPIGWHRALVRRFIFSFFFYFVLEGVSIQGPGGALSLRPRRDLGSRPLRGSLARGPERAFYHWLEYSYERGCTLSIGVLFCRGVLPLKRRDWIDPTLVNQ